MDALTKECRTMRRYARALLLGGAAAVSALGCRNPCEPVEHELHARENELLAAREELERCHAINESLQMELQAVHGDPNAATPGDSDKPSAMVYPIRSLTLGLQTGGRDGDASGGDEALQVVVEPRDADNQSVKVPGTLLIQAVEITPSGLKQPLSNWQISEDELRRSWRSGLLTTGYVLVLPWKVWPSNEKVRVVVQFHANDGRLFEADKDITVHVVPAAKRPAPPMPPPADGPTLPPPRPLPPPDPVPMPSDHGPELNPVPQDPAKAAWLPDVPHGVRTARADSTAGRLSPAEAALSTAFIAGRGCAIAQKRPRKGRRR